MLWKSCQYIEKLKVYLDQLKYMDLSCHSAIEINRTEINLSEVPYSKLHIYFKMFSLALMVWRLYVFQAIIPSITV